MPIRQYLAPQRGTGTDADPYTSILNDLIDITQGEGFDEIDHPARRYSICTVTASQATHDVIAADARVTVITPRTCADAADFRAVLDAPFSSWPQAWRDAARARCETLGINTEWITASNTLRDVIRYLIRQHFFCQIADGGANGNVKALLSANLAATVGDLPAQVRNGVRNWMQARGLAIGWITNSTTIREVVHFVVTTLGFGVAYFGGEAF